MTSPTPRILFASCLALAACGPSSRGIVESDMRFEHCYRIDEDARVARSDKLTCWEEWSARYARDPDSARVRYADDRRAVLDDDARTEAEPAPITTATPTSAYVPPVATEEPKVARSPSDLPLRDPAECRTDCLHALGACLALCVPGTDCAPHCSASRKTCEHACE